MVSSSRSPRILGVGIVDCGEITQVAHIPTLSFLADLFRVTYLCAVSEGAFEALPAKGFWHRLPETTRNAAQLCASADVDVVLVANSDEYHAVHAILALEHSKHVFVEKPMALNIRDADAIIDAESKSSGKLMVGYMRRYAPAFVDAVKENGGLGQVLYARVRGENSWIMIRYNLWRLTCNYRHHRTKQHLCVTVRYLSKAVNRFSA